MQLKDFVDRLAFAAVSVALVALLIVTTLAWQRAEQVAVDQLDELTREISRRSNAAREEELALVEKLSQMTQADDCSAEGIDRMRQLSAPYGYIKGVGRLDGSRLLCTSLVNLEQPLQLGAPHRVSPDGQLSWSDMQIPGLPGTPFKIDGRRNFAIFMIARQVIDVLPLDSTLSIAHISTSAHPWKIVRRNGPFGFEDLLQRQELPTAHFFWLNDHLLTVTPIDSPPAIAVASMPRETFNQLVWSQAASLALPATLLSLLLVGLIAWLPQHITSFKSKLRRAIRLRQFSMVYQPVIELSSGRCVGAESLVRWFRPNGGMVSPVVFIPEAERLGLIGQITQQVVSMVGRDLNEHAHCTPDTHFGINLSAADLADACTLPRLEQLLRETHLDPHNFIVEVTESGLLQPEIAQKTIIEMRAKGFRVAIDDFGTGHSSLSYLATYELDILKIDKRFVDALDGDGPSAKLAFHIIGIAKSLGLQMIAEGVETPRQLEILRAEGVQYAQGWLFAKPMSMPELMQFIEKTRSPATPTLSSAPL